MSKRLGGVKAAKAPISPAARNRTEPSWKPRSAVADDSAASSAAVAAQATRIQPRLSIAADSPSQSTGSARPQCNRESAVSRGMRKTAAPSAAYSEASPSSAAPNQRFDSSSKPKPKSSPAAAMPRTSASGEVTPATTVSGSSLSSRTRSR